MIQLSEEELAESRFQTAYLKRMFQEKICVHHCSSQVEIMVKIFTKDSFLTGEIVSLFIRSLVWNCIEQVEHFFIELNCIALH